MRLVRVEFYLVVIIYGDNLKTVPVRGYFVEYHTIECDIVQIQLAIGYAVLDADNF